MNSRIYFYFIALVFVLNSCTSSYSPVNNYEVRTPKVSKLSDSTFVFENNFLSKNSHQMWELYNSGNPLQLGYNNGALSNDLMYFQEKVFVDKIKDFVPSKFKQKILRLGLQWYTRNMHKHVKSDYLTELYGLSQFYSDDFNFVGPKYERSLSYHAAHDIGHALQDLMLVGCSSIAVWDDNTENGKMLVGRAFDFYVGDDFARNKVINFINPDKGFSYASVSWPGMIGVVSGMNVKGVTVTINAGKSKIPLSAKNPISLVTREILQYASNINEAIAIAKRQQVFVSESILVSSGSERKAVIIEISPKNFGVYDSPNSSDLICTNHFQSEAYKNDKRNQEHIKDSHSKYRFEKLTELLSEKKQLNPIKMAEILRDRSGVKHANIGNGNEKSINQLLGHHAVIFSPEDLVFWVSSSPYQLGEFVAYDLNDVFNNKSVIGQLERKDLLIPKDQFLDSEEYKNYEKYREYDRIIEQSIADKKFISQEWINDYINLNPQLWLVYYRAGRYYFEQKKYSDAKLYFEKALSKTISSESEKLLIQKYLSKSLEKK